MRFSKLLNTQLVKITDNNNYFTFNSLTTIKDFAIASTPAEPDKSVFFSKTYAGTPQEILKENHLTFSLQTKKIVPIESINQNITGLLHRNKNSVAVSAKFLIQAHSFYKGNRITKFIGSFNFKYNDFRYLGYNS
jgi:hypothetical protein